MSTRRAQKMGCESQSELIKSLRQVLHVTTFRILLLYLLLRLLYLLMTSLTNSGPALTTLRFNEGANGTEVSGALVHRF